MTNPFKDAYIGIDWAVYSGGSGTCATQPLLTQEEIEGYRRALRAMAADGRDVHRDYHRKRKLLLVTGDLK